MQTLQPNVLVIGAEPKMCASFCAALAAGYPVKVEMQSPTLADGLAVPCVGPHSFAVAR
jgi:threonine dehydratase